MPEEPEPKEADYKALTLRLPEEWHEALRKRAFDERRPIAVLIREAIAQAFGFESPDEGRKGGACFAP